MESLIIIFAAFALGGILKGATGAGAPVLAIPVMAIYFDLPFAVTVYSIPNLAPNLWQSWAFRKDRLSLGFVAPFVVAGALGAAIGTYMLTSISNEILSLVLAGAIGLYIVFRLLRPEWGLSLHRGKQMAFPVGILAGALQGSSGLSAPISLTFLTALHLERKQFISTVSMFFVGLGLVQVPMLAGYGYLTPANFLLSCIALIPLALFMPVGGLLVRHISRERFNQIILGLLAVLSVKLVVEAVG